MKNKTVSQVTVVALSSIHPDENQPRKHFAADRIRDLVDSIKQEGLVNPLVISKRKEGGYILVDGERRFRALTELKVKEVPTIILDELNDTERLIKQFHIQEQHEGWSGVEKAKAMKKLSQIMGMDMKELGKILGLSEMNTREYVAFGNLLEGKEFERTKSPLKSAEKINSIKNVVRRAFENEGREFEVEDERELERAIIKRIESGEIREGRDFVRVKDTFIRDPKSIQKFLKGGGLNEMYKNTHANDYADFRNIFINTGWLLGQLKKTNMVESKKLFAKDATATERVIRAASALAEFAREIA